jgi:hypothetical membrane protein
MKSEYARIGVTHQKTAAIMGAITPIIFIGLVIFESLLRPGYSQIADEISFLGVGKHSTIQNWNFIITGVLFLIFGFGFAKAVSATTGRTSHRIETCFVLSGLGLIFAGITLIFAGQATSNSTTVDFFYLHTISSFIGFSALIAIQFFSWRSLKNGSMTEWGNYEKYSLISGFFSVILLIVFILTSTSAIEGATERTFAVVPLIWTMVTGIKSYSVSNRIGQ